MGESPPTFGIIFPVVPNTMSVSFLHVFVVAQCLSLAISSPLDSIFDPVLGLDGTPTYLDGPGIFAAGTEASADPIFLDPGSFEINPDPSVSLFPAIASSEISFDIGLGGAEEGTNFLLAEGDQCGTRERACCLRGDNDCYTAPSSQCSNKPILCCDRVDTVSRAGINCQAAISVPQPQPPSSQPQTTPAGHPLEPSDEDYFNFLFGLN